ncbi:MAG: hypothetical protein QF554_06650 [Dehalococcoidia bacterium]|jgi:hypothetical protein|nr:hypothetical protein [Dehalococcoidia bacterium]
MSTDRPANDGLIHGYHVYRVGDRTPARGRVDGEVLVESGDACVVPQRARDALEPSGGSLDLEPGAYLIDEPLTLPSMVTVTGRGRATVLRLGERNRPGAIWGNEFIDNGAATELRTHGAYLHGDAKSVQITGNTIFSWDGMQPRLGGIYEDADCRDNQIAHNTINYFTDEGCIRTGWARSCRTTRRSPAHALNRESSLSPKNSSDSRCSIACSPPSGSNGLWS